MKKSSKELTYGDYLQLDKLLQSQNLMSDATGKTAHHELFFIIIHQTYELWFKQMLAELDHVIEIMQQMDKSLHDLPEALNSLERFNKIQQLLNQQIPVLETLSTADFLTFRNLLGTASGNQSYQFRLLEIRLGLYYKNPIKTEDFYKNFEAKQQKLFDVAAKKASLFDVIEKWLLHYSKDTKKYLAHYNKDLDAKLTALQKRGKVHVNNVQLEHLKSVQESFEQILDESGYQEECNKGLRRLNYQSFLCALFLSLNQNDINISPSYKVLKKLIEMDELMAVWRYHHALMVQRMIGNKFGTGGTSGYIYLRSTVEKNRIFTEFTNLSTYLFSDIYLDY